MTKTTKILLAIAFLLLALTAGILSASSSVFLQLFIAFALAYILNPAVTFLERKRIPRIPGILIVFTAALVATIGFSSFLILSISKELSNIQINLPGYAQHLYEVTPQTIKSYLGIETQLKLSQQVDSIVLGVRSSAPDLVRPLLTFMQRAFSSTTSLLLSLLGYFIIPVYLFYLLADMPQLKHFPETYIPERFRDIYQEKLAEIDTILSGFIRGQISVCAILAVLYSIGLYWIGIDLAIAIGMLSGITFIIPYVGTIIGIVLSVIMAFLKFHDLLHPLLCVGWFSLVQVLEGMIITPKIVGDTVGLHPLVAIIALLIGGQIFGIMGMLLAVPVTAVAQVFLRSLTAYYHASDFYRGTP